MEFTFNEHDLEGNYTSPSDCPIYRCLKRSGVDVYLVSPSEVAVGNSREYKTYTLPVNLVNTVIRVSKNPAKAGDIFIIEGL